MHYKEYWLSWSVFGCNPLTCGPPTVIEGCDVFRYVHLSSILCCVCLHWSCNVLCIPVLLWHCVCLSWLSLCAYLSWSLTTCVCWPCVCNGVCLSWSLSTVYVWLSCCSAASTRCTCFGCLLSMSEFVALADVSYITHWTCWPSSNTQPD